MTKPFSLFFLASTLFFSNCGCGNSDEGHGPKDIDVKILPKGEEEGTKSKEEKVAPRFNLSLADGVKQEDVNVNQPIPLVLKGENLLKGGTKFSISKWTVEKGTLHFMDSQGGAGEKIKRREVEFKDGVLPLIFVPNGETGKVVISVGVMTSGEYFNDISIELDLKSMISLKVPVEVETSKPIKAYLKIDLWGEFTLKSVSMDKFPIMIIKDNRGEVEGGWADPGYVRVGDKFSKGDLQLKLKLYGANEKKEYGEEVFEATKSEWFSQNSVLTMVFVDEDGKEYSTQAKFKVVDKSFEVKIDGVEWNQYNQKFKEEGIYELKMKINKWDGWEADKKEFTILSVKSNDGADIEAVNSKLENVIGQHLEKNYWGVDINLHFKKLTKFYGGNPTILTIKVQGPGGVVKSTALSIDRHQRDRIFQNMVSALGDKAKELSHNRWRLRDGDEEGARKICEEIAEFLKTEKVVILESLEKTIQEDLEKNYSWQSREGIKRVCFYVSILKGELKDLNKEFKFYY